MQYEQGAGTGTLALALGATGTTAGGDGEGRRDGMTETQRPECVKDEHLEYLDELRESGATNMFGARPYLMNEFWDLTKQEAAAILTYWMGTFGERHP